MRQFIKTISFRSVFVLFLITLSTQFLFADQLSTPAEDKQFQAILDEGRTDPAIARLLEEWSSNLWVQDETDARLARVMKGSRLVQKILREIKHRLLEQLKEEEAFLRHQTGKARRAGTEVSKAGQYPRLHQLAMQARDGVRFPIPVSLEPRIYVLNEADPNAFTGSPFPDLFPVIGVHRGLLELLNDQEQVAVLLHESGHEKFSHPLITTTVMAVLLATGEISIPDKDRNKPVIFERLSSILKTHIRELIQHEFRRKYGPASHAPSEMIDSFTQLSFIQLMRLKDYIVEIINNNVLSYSDYQPENLFALLSNIGDAVLGRSFGKRIRIDIRNLAKGSEQDQEARKKELFNFLHEIIRSGEISADHQAVHAVGGRTVAWVMAKLAGGKEADLDSFLQQDSDTQNPSDPINEDIERRGDHPTLLRRAKSNLTYEVSLESLTYHHIPFLRVLDDYAGVAQRIEKQQRGIYDNNLLSSNLDENVEKEISSSVLGPHETKTKNAIVKAVMAEFGKETKPIKFLVLVEYFSRLAAKGVAFPDRLNETDGLFGTLTEQLRALGSDTAKQAVKVIQKLSSLRPKPVPNSIDTIGASSEQNSNALTSSRIRSSLSPLLSPLGRVDLVSLTSSVACEQKLGGHGQQ